MPQLSWGLGSLNRLRPISSRKSPERVRGPEAAGDIHALAWCIEMVPAMIAALVLAAFGPRHHEIDIAATALQTYQPLAPIED